MVFDGLSSSPTRFKGFEQVVFILFGVVPVQMFIYLRILGFSVEEGDISDMLSPASVSPAFCRLFYLANCCLLPGSMLHL